MIFNKDNKGSQEMRLLTGSYYANNNFEKVKSQIGIVTEELIKIIGRPVYERAEAAYLAQGDWILELGKWNDNGTWQDTGVWNDDPEAVRINKLLVVYVQLPIAILSTLRMYQRNDISHEDTGRKMKVDNESEKIPWEWQIDKDDKTHLDDYYRAVDMLIGFLDRNNIEQWIDSSQKQLTKTLFLKDADAYDLYYPISRSGRVYHLIVPFMRDVQRRKIKPALGDDYKKYLSGENLTDTDKELIVDYVCPAIALFSMALAFERLPLGAIPFGVVRNYTSASQTMRASEPATMEEIKQTVARLRADAEDILADMKNERSPGGSYQLIPKNSPCNKYMSV